MPQKAANTDTESPAIGLTFEHKETGERVKVVQHMFNYEDNPTTPFVVQRESDGGEIGFEVPEKFYSDYERVGRTDTKRFGDDVSGDKLIEGDRISKDLVARTPGQLGQVIRPSHPEKDSPPVTQLVAITEIGRYDDVHHAILLDPDTETFVRASRDDSNYAMSQKGEDWKVRDVGTEITVTDATVDDWGESEPADGDVEWTQEWIEVVFGDIQAGHLDEYDDRRSLSGTTLSIHDEYGGHKATATIKLEE